METAAAEALLHSSPDQSTSPYKHRMRNPKRKHHRSLISPCNNYRGGILHGPPSSLSPSAISLLNRHRQPPLLPLPVPNSNKNSPKTHGKTRDHQPPLVQKEPKQSLTSPRNEGPKRDLKCSLGPAPEDLLHPEKFSDSAVLTLLSPPPSSLPLPTFPLRPKVVSCTVEAAGIDAGATDNLRRLLRLP